MVFSTNSLLTSRGKGTFCMLQFSLPLDQRNVLNPKKMLKTCLELYSNKSPAKDSFVFEPDGGYNDK